MQCGCRSVALTYLVCTVENALNLLSAEVADGGIWNMVQHSDNFK